MDFLKTFSRLFDVWYFACLLWVFKTCLALCPSDVQTYASDCFSHYKTQLKHMQKTDRTLFSGVDVENLRSLCSSYKGAILCIQSLHNECPPEKHDQIDISQILSFDGSQTDLSEICKDDTILEVYARNQNCFIIHGQYSEQCFLRDMDLNISSINDVINKPINKFCSDMKGLNSCISTNILLKCGKEAESLVHILIQASIKRSSECENSVPLSQTSSSGTSNQNRKGQTGSNSSNSVLRIGTSYTTLSMCLIYLVLKHSIRLLLEGDNHYFIC